MCCRMASPLAIVDTTLAACRPLPRDSDGANNDASADDHGHSRYGPHLASCGKLAAIWVAAPRTHHQHQHQHPTPSRTALFLLLLRKYYLTTSLRLLPAHLVFTLLPVLPFVFPAVRFILDVCTVATCLCRAPAGATSVHPLVRHHALCFRAKRQHQSGAFHRDRGQSHAKLYRGHAASPAPGWFVFSPTCAIGLLPHIVFGSTTLSCCHFLSFV